MNPPAHNDVNHIEEIKSIIRQELSELKANESQELQGITEIKTILAKHESFSGPLPRPDHFNAYNKALPGAANRILKMSEDDLTHTHFMQKGYLILDGVTSVVGLLIGGVIALAGIGGGVYLATLGQPITGTLFGGATMASVVGVFIYGTKYNKKS